MLIALALPVLGACAEDLESGRTCPILCPVEAPEMEEVVIEPVILDTTLVGLAPIGTEAALLVSSRGDSVQTRAVIRFDSLPSEYRPDRSSADTEPIGEAVTARLRLRVDTTSLKIFDEAVLTLYDVDTDLTAPPEAVTSLFTPDRRIGSIPFADARVADTLFIPLESSVVFDKIQAGERLRVGVEVSAAGESVQMLVLSAASGATPVLLVVPEVSELVDTLFVTPRSRTPEDDRARAFELADYTAVLVPTPSPGPGEFLVGGMPPRRTYLRFALPEEILKNSTVVRATLTLHQKEAFDTVTIVPLLVVAGSVVTDPTTAALLSQPFAQIGIPPQFLDAMQGESGPQELQLAGAVRQWAAVDLNEVPPALVLQIVGEAITPGWAIYYSSEAAPELRPTLRLTYIPNREFGLP